MTLADDDPITLAEASELLRCDLAHAGRCRDLAGGRIFGHEPADGRAGLRAPQSYISEGRSGCGDKETSVMSDITKRLRQYEGDISQTTMCYNGAREEAAAEIDALREARVRAEAYIKAMRVRTESLESLLRRWIALDAGCWHPNRHEDNTTELIGDTRAALGWGNKS